MLRKLYVVCGDDPTECRECREHGMAPPRCRRPRYGENYPDDPPPVEAPLPTSHFKVHSHAQ